MMMAGAPGQVSCGWSWHIVILLAPHWPKSVFVCVWRWGGCCMHACMLGGGGRVTQQRTWIRKEPGMGTDDSIS